jgi:hypothetical protein
MVRRQRLAAVPANRFADGKEWDIQWEGRRPAVNFIRPFPDAYYGKRPQRICALRPSG